MPRNKTLFLYNGSRQNQDWQIYSEGVINQNVTIGQVRKSYTISLSGDVTIQFGVDDSVYLTSTYTYETDTWTYHTDTPPQWNFSTSQSAVNVTCNFVPEAESDDDGEG